MEIGYFLSAEEHGPLDLVVSGGLKVCWGADERERAELARRLWRTSFFDMYERELGPWLAMIGSPV